MTAEYTVTWLAMDARPAIPRRERPDPALSLVRAHRPPVHFFRYLYAAVGSDYQWEDLNAETDAQIADFAQADAMHLNIAYMAGCPAGFVMLDFRESSVCEIAYFGLVPEFIGHGLGSWLMLEGVHQAWDAGIDRLTVNTCTLDHPAALPLYRRMGFVPVRSETRRRETVDRVSI